ncbi:assimilatory sulfite reductase (NADPH) flavoprotein subunit [Salinicola socius]|uniref:Sulfite reductase [NADPH] flavoprotein alpha-component n=1 Tax=Salinicola socius TaxID=404433 RepID=A0A1Q8SXK7_9GAMM|nr:assimilatory sulfite reductase (NADPH) flavoprotein subunit [Salinicola socius]OLO06130.1 sulfite reductase [NADPH] flavoprotein, alpha-component [Salinicola socius]
MAPNSLTDTNSPLSADQAKRVQQALADLDASQRQWLSGYLAGLGAQAAAGTTQAGASQTTPTASTTLTVLYGSQTGNAEGVAELAAERAGAKGFDVTLLSMADASKKTLKAVERLLVVVSTQGDGDPPDPALEFHELMMGRKAPKLAGLRFAVLGLGDASYEHFCQTGKEFDARLAELGGEAIHERMDCDVDYEETAETWIDEVLESLAGDLATPPPTQVAATDASQHVQPRYSKKHPFLAEVLTSQPLNGRDSDKQTLHLELSLEESGLEYLPGDAVGVVPQNDPGHVDELIEMLKFDAESPLEEGRVLRDALLTDFEVTTLTRPFLQQWAEWSQAPELRRLLGEEARDELRDWLHGRQIIDVVEQFPVEGIDAAQFSAALRKLPPRLYSIASSQAAVPDEVHLTVAVVRYETHGRARNGVTTSYLADRIEPGDRVPIYIDRNKQFKLPDDDEAPLIMIGPGTGVAPFRAFLQEREERGAGGDNWLFFGDRRFRSDFLYQSEWLKWRQHGLLTRLDVAFSRDQADKVYVQDRLREQAETLYAWLEAGAYVYVCGDAEFMAPDVHQALRDVIREQGGHGEAGADDYLREMQQEKRYQRDIY